MFVCAHMQECLFRSEAILNNYLTLTLDQAKKKCFLSSLFSYHFLCALPLGCWEKEVRLSCGFTLHCGWSTTNNAHNAVLFPSEGNEEMSSVSLQRSNVLLHDSFYFYFSELY